MTPDKVAQYASLFEKSGAEDGILPGERAKQIFERAGLPNETLGRIWNLADTEQRGALTVTEFIVAMHLLASSKSGVLRALPNTLPPGLYEAAARRGPVRQMSGVPTGTPAVPPIPGQFSGAAAGRTGSPMDRPGFPAPIQAQPTGAGGWVISPADKARFDAIYVTLDKTNRGFITGDEAVPFFSNSKLPEEVLAQIWDLADINSQGQLTRDEFAVAMYLIRQQRGKRDGRDTLPSTLPADLIPPSMRNQVRPPQQPTAPAFEQPAAPIPKSAADDLFGLDAMSSPAPAPAPAPTQQPLSTGGSGFGADPFGSSKAPIAPHSPPSSSTAPLSAQNTGFKPFVPSSSFGQTLTSHATGGSATSMASRPATRSPPVDDLLGDNDPEISKKLTNETAEIANLGNQAQTLSKQMHDVQGQKANAQSSLNDVTAQKRDLEARLGHLRSAYENEATEVRSLQQQFQEARNATQQLQQELSTVEASYHEVQGQHTELTQALQGDQQENAELKERIRAMNAEIAQLKPQLEKLRSGARQQKGLVAINRKQLLTNEGERDKLNSEATELNKSIEEDTKALNERPSTAVSSRADGPAVASPAGSTMSASNPFFRRAGSTSETSFSPFPSPPPQPQPGTSFENIFGPSFENAVNTELPHTPMPPTTFKQGEPERPTSAAADRSTTPLSDGGVPPAPEPSKQITSSFLPFPGHNESVTSSRQVSAPGSRFDDNSIGADTPRGAIAATPTGSSVTDESHADGNKAASPAPEQTRSMSESMPGSFPGETNSNGSAFGDSSDPFAPAGEKQKASNDNFDSAFAGFGGQSEAVEKEPEPSAAKFNQEFPPVEEFDNDDDSTDSERGFDDDFAPGSAAHSRNVSIAQVVTDKPVETKLDAAEQPAVTTGSVPPITAAQSSPPPYDKSVTSQERAQVEAHEFDGLLPSREDPTSPVGPNSVSSAQREQPAATTAPAVNTEYRPAPPPKTDFDDFDDFDNLEDAKEGDLDDDFANLSVNDKSIDEFNPMFDTPSDSRTNTAQASAFGGSSGFGDFTQSPVANTSQQAGGPGASGTNDNDWDAIFAGLDNGSAPNGGGADKKVVVDEAFGGAAPTRKEDERPQLGRALTEAGEHDDPILKNLTNMGYPRKAALAALEKYDYNVERVK